MTKNKVNAGVKEMKEVKEHAGFVVDVEEELRSAGYSVVGLHPIPEDGYLALYAKEAKTPDELYEKLFPFLRKAEEYLSVTGRTSFFQYDFKGSYSSQVVRSKEGEVVNVQHWFFYSFSTDTPWGFSVSVNVKGELDAPAPKGKPVTCDVFPFICIGPVPTGRWKEKKTKELVLNISRLFATQVKKLPEEFPEAGVYVVLEKTRKGVGESTFTRYLGKAGEVFLPLISERTGANK